MAKPLRIVTGGISQETNTFQWEPTALSDFEKGSSKIVRGQQILAQGDLGYWRWMIWIEYDGEEYHALRRFDGRDQRKDRWLSRRGWEV